MAIPEQVGDDILNIENAIISNYIFHYTTQKSYLGII
jgi:hypothetical protein